MAGRGSPSDSVLGLVVAGGCLVWFMVWFRFWVRVLVVGVVGELWLVSCGLVSCGLVSEASTVFDSFDLLFC